MLLDGLFACAPRIPTFARVLLLSLLVVFVPACRSCGKSGPPQRLSVSVSIFPVYDLVRRVAGPDADVTLIATSSDNVRAFKPSAEAVEVTSRARLGVMVGLDFDPWMEQLMLQAAPKARVLKVGDRVPTLAASSSFEPSAKNVENPAMDPYVWLDPERARLIVRAIAEELGRADGGHALDYRKRATELDASLAAIDQELEGRIKALTSRTFATYGGSFQYLGERYHLEIIRLPELGKPPHTTEVQNLVKSRKVAAIFYEIGRESEIAAVAVDAHVPTGPLTSLGGSPDTDTYEKLLRFNVSSLEKRLKSM